MSSSVWVSKAPADSSLADGVTLSDLSGHGNQQLIRLSQTGRRGGVVAPNEFPKEIWGQVGDYRAHHFPNYWPEISYYSGLWIVSGTVAAILESVDLGGGVVAPVRRFERDHATPVPGEWFCWNVGNVKTAFLGPRSKSVIAVGSNMWLPVDVKDHDLKCSHDAETGPDAWFDPQLHDMLFLSARLGRAVIDAQLATEKAGFGPLIECDITEHRTHDE